jgi:hypothetical protein
VDNQEAFIFHRTSNNFNMVLLSSAQEIPPSCFLDRIQREEVHTQRQGIGRYPALQYHPVFRDIVSGWRNPLLDICRRSGEQDSNTQERTIINEIFPFRMANNGMILSNVSVLPPGSVWLRWGIMVRKPMNERARDNEDIDDPSSHTIRRSAEITNKPAYIIFTLLVVYPSSKRFLDGEIYD